MTVESAMSRVVYLGDGTQTAFAFAFPVLDAAHLRVSTVDPVSGVETPAVVGLDATVALDPSGGGTATFAAAPASGRHVVIAREVPATQPTRYLENDAFPAATHEAALDRLTMLAQQLADRLDRTLAVDRSEPAPLPLLPPRATRAGRTLMFDGTGAPVAAQLATPGALVVSTWVSTALLGAVDAAAARTALGAPALAGANVFGAPQTVRLADNGAGAGPDLCLDRSSASPAANDALARLRLQGRDAAGATVDYAEVAADVQATTAGSARGRLLLRALRNGAKALVAWCGDGLVVGAPTGGDKGAGSINAQTIWLDGTALGPAAGANVGTGSGVFRDLSGSTLRFRSLRVETVATNADGGTGIADASLEIAAGADDIVVRLRKTFNPPLPPPGP